MTTNTKAPLRPAYVEAAANHGKNFWRACAAQVIVKQSGSTKTRAVPMPLTTTTGAEFAALATTGLLTGLAPASAAAKLFSRCSRVVFDGVDKIIIPRIATSDAPVFVAEGSAHTVVQSVADYLALSQFKMLFSSVVTNEIASYAIETAATLIQKALTAPAATQLDAEVFGDTAATPGLRPAGLLAGVNDLGPTAGGGLAAITEDISNIVGAMSDAGISSDDLMLFTNPRQPIVLKMLAEFAPENIVGTPAIVDGTLIGISPAGIVSGFDGALTFEVSEQGTVVMESAAPVGDIDAAAVAASNIRSLWQENLLAVRLRLRCSWAPLAAAAVQKVVAVTW